MSEHYVHIDPKIVADGTVTKQCFAVVRAARRGRKRFPVDCVEVLGSAAEAQARANPTEQRYPAEVLGPSRSSEGVQLFYLLRWLD
jgi:hypothetical protein